VASENTVMAKLLQNKTIILNMLNHQLNDTQVRELNETHQDEWEVEKNKWINKDPIIIGMKEVMPKTFDIISNFNFEQENVEGEMMRCFKVINDWIKEQMKKGDTTVFLLGPIGPPEFMNIFSRANRRPIIFARSKRISEDIPQEDGSVKKTTVFRHIGFSFNDMEEHVWKPVADWHPSFNTRKEDW